MQPNLQAYAKLSFAALLPPDVASRSLFDLAGIQSQQQLHGAENPAHLGQLVE